jgi:hypothetical protein
MRRARHLEIAILEQGIGADMRLWEAAGQGQTALAAFAPPPEAATKIGLKQLYADRAMTTRPPDLCQNTLTEPRR